MAAFCTIQQSKGRQSKGAAYAAPCRVTTIRCDTMQCGGFSLDGTVGALLHPNACDCAVHALFFWSFHTRTFQTRPCRTRLESTRLTLSRSSVRPHLRLLSLHADHTHRSSPTVTPASTSTWVVFMLPERVSPRVPAPTSALPPRGSRPTRPTWRTRSAVWPKRV